MTTIRESRPTPPLEVAHVLFMDIVAYSTLPMDKQQQLLSELQESVRTTSEFAQALAHHQLIRLPTGDGMALVFFRDPEAPIRCALELSRNLREHPDIKLRMGIHSGPVYRIEDINANRNVAGGGINFAQRVMDCGDAGHILVSKSVSEVLNQLSRWKGLLQDLGEAEVKHGIRIHLYNLFTDDAGNPALPAKIGGQVATPRPSLPKVKQRSLTPAVASVAAALVVVLIVVGWLFHLHKTHALSATDTVVVGDFANKTGDPTFDDTVRRGLIVQLDQSPFLNLVSAEHVQQTLRSMARPPDSPLTSELSRELCRTIGSKAYLEGSIESPSGHYVLSVRAVNCRTGGKLADERIQPVDKDDILKAISELGRKLRKDLGESTDSIRRFDIALDTATPSLETLHAYASGWNMLEGRGQYPKVGEEITTEWFLAAETPIQKYAKAAVPFFQQAVHWDSNFALGYLALAKCYLHIGGPYSENATKAYQLRDRVGERQRFIIQSVYYDLQKWDGHHHVQEARDLYAAWERAYPRDAQLHLERSMSYYELGQYERYLQELHQAKSLEPETEDYWRTFSVLLYLNRLPEAENELKEARAKNWDSFYLQFESYRLAFLQNDVAGMSREMDWAAGKPFAYGFLDLEADTAAYFGRFGKARELSRRALQSAKQNNDWGGAWGAVASQVLREVLVGNIEEGRRAGASFDDYATFSQEKLALASVCW